MGWKTWRRPTLPRLRTQYHGRWGFSRPSSGRDRVRAPRQSHQVVRSIQQLSVFSRRLSDAEWCGSGVCFPTIDDCQVATAFLAMISMHGVLDRSQSGDQNRSASWVAPLPHPACQRDGLSRPSGRTRLEVSFPLRCFQRLSCPYLATRPCHWRDNRCTRGMSIPVLSY